MNGLAILLIVGSVIAISKAAMTDEQMQAMQKVTMECAIQEKASQADLEELMANKPPSTKEANCLHACMSEAFGVVKDNKLSADGLVGMGSMMFDGDESKIQIFRDIADACAGQTDADRCEASAKICHCIHDQALARGLQFDV